MTFHIESGNKDVKDSGPLFLWIYTHGNLISVKLVPLKLVRILDRKVEGTWTTPSSESNLATPIINIECHQLTSDWTVAELEGLHSGRFLISHVRTLPQ